MKKLWLKTYWIIRVFVITVVLIIIFHNLVYIESDEIKKVIGAILMFLAMLLDNLITGKHETN